MLIDSGDLQGLPKGSKGIDLRAKVTVFATATHPFENAGEELSMHPNLAEDFEKKGFVVRSARKTANN